jgi:hypothetical protein
VLIKAVFSFGFRFGKKWFGIGNSSQFSQFEISFVLGWLGWVWPTSLDFMVVNSSLMNRTMLSMVMVWASSPSFGFPYNSFGLV